MQKILIIEDEPAILMGLKDELSLEYEVYTADKGEKGLQISFEKEPELILLDLILPDMDGYEVCRRLKDGQLNASIIMVTARDQVVDKIKGLELGADDYITKPFNLEELKARVKAVLRRRQAIAIDNFETKGLKIDFKKYQAILKNRQLDLTALEFKLLRYLIFHRANVVSRDQLLEEVWGYKTDISTRTIDAHVLSLRKKLGRSFISTVHGVGYRFES
jgi:DNA-binding response OmpR family regulator